MKKKKPFKGLILLEKFNTECKPRIEANGAQVVWDDKHKVVFIKNKYGQNIINFFPKSNKICLTDLKGNQKWLDNGYTRIFLNIDSNGTLKSINTKREYKEYNKEKEFDNQPLIFFGQKLSDYK